MNSSAGLRNPWKTTSMICWRSIDIESAWRRSRPSSSGPKCSRNSGITNDWVCAVGFVIAFLPSVFLNERSALLGMVSSASRLPDVRSVYAGSYDSYITNVSPPFFGFGPL